MHGARNLYEERLQFFLFQELEKLEAADVHHASTTGHRTRV
jgi:hypothetical protein